VLVTDSMVRRLMGEVTRLAKPELGCITVDALPRSTFRAVTLSGAELGLIQFSSGSTSAPKPVALSHRALMHQLEMLRTLMPDDARDHVGVSWLPLYHDMGLIGALLSAAYYPGPLALIQPQHFLARPSIWLRTLSKYGGTISPAPNFAYGLCLKRVKDDELQGVDLSRWRYALNGAEPISVGVMRKFSERFGKYGFNADAMLPVYGLSEASLAVTFAPRSQPRRTTSIDSPSGGARELTSVGVPVPGTELEVRSEDGAVLTDGTLGELHIKTPSLMDGYDGQPDATMQVLRDGWLNTGDLGFIRDGELFVFGRSKDVIILRGANHAPQEFEDALESVEGVRPGCAVALGFIPEDAEGEALLLLVETADEVPADLEARVRAAVLERTHERPHTVVLLPPGTLPRTSSGKLRRREALLRYQAATLSPPKAVNALTVGTELARSAVGFLRARIP
jgi:acyl-CoA synthetase (AMP-forming)/AMP-acid ligase II